MKENDKCEQYLHIFLKLPQAGFKLDYWINNLIVCCSFFNHLSWRTEYFSLEFLFSSGCHEVISFYKIIALTIQP